MQALTNNFFFIKNELITRKILLVHSCTVSQRKNLKKIEYFCLILMWLDSKYGVNFFSCHILQMSAYKGYPRQMDSKISYINSYKLMSEKKIKPKWNTFEDWNWLILYICSPFWFLQWNNMNFRFDILYNLIVQNLDCFIDP